MYGNLSAFSMIRHINDLACHIFLWRRKRSRIIVAAITTKVRPIMKEKILPFRQVEWWLMTILIFLIILTTTLGAKINLDVVANAGIDLIAQSFSYICIPFRLYAAFHSLHRKILPAYRRDGQQDKMILNSLLTFLTARFIVGIFHVHADFGDDPSMAFSF